MENWLAFGQSDVWESFGRAGFAVGLAWDRFWDKFDVTLDPNGITLVLFYRRFGPVWDIALRLLMEMFISFAICVFFFAIIERSNIALGVLGACKPNIDRNSIPQCLSENWNKPSK